MFAMTCNLDGACSVRTLLLSECDDVAYRIRLCAATDRLCVHCSYRATDTQSSQCCCGVGCICVYESVGVVAGVCQTLALKSVRW
jgi:hypothetical protein